MIPDAGHLEVESERVYVVYDGKTGKIAHIHRVVTHRGATQVSDEQGEARALEMASRFGHRRETLRVLRTASFDGGVPQRVNVKTLQLAPDRPTESQRPIKSAAGKRQRTAPRRKR